MCGDETHSHIQPLYAAWRRIGELPCETSADHAAFGTAREAIAESMLGLVPETAEEMAALVLVSTNEGCRDLPRHLVKRLEVFAEDLL